MTSLQEYIEEFRDIGRSLGITGQSVEVLSHLLANAVFISEMENATYMKESSLEKCSLLNSKIQHCVDNMYSVYRGACPRAIIKFKPLKYMTLNPYDKIITSQKFSIYFLGYWKEGEGWIYSNKTYYPNETPEKIICLLAKETASISKEINSKNTYYVECTEDSLSDDCYVTIQGNKVPRTRIFAEHILEHSVFDLTLPSYGSRLFFANYYKDTVERDSQEIMPMTEKSVIGATYFKYSTLDTYNEVELERVKLQGGELVDFDEGELISLTGGEDTEQYAKGLYYVEALSRDDSGTIHYKANRDRYVNSIIRSNSDIGVVLEETFPDRVKSGGTNYVFSTSAGFSSIDIYYIPINDNNLLKDDETKTFGEEKRAYYIITDVISVKKGVKYIANFNISIDLFENASEDWMKLIGEEILKEGYARKFNVTFDSDTLEEIRTLISKLSNVKKITQLDLTVMDENNVPYQGEINPEISYFDITFSIATTVRV